MSLMVCKPTFLQPPLSFPPPGKEIFVRRALGNIIAVSTSVPGLLDEQSNHPTCCFIKFLEAERFVNFCISPTCIFPTFSH